MSESILAFDTFQNRLRVRGHLVTQTGLRIGVGRDTDVAGLDLPVIRDQAGRPFIPGSSFKGVLRSQLESLLRGLSAESSIQQRLACQVLLREQRCIPDARLQVWRDTIASPVELSQKILGASCLICQTFGSPWLASHIALRDLPVVSEFWLGQFEVRQGVALDRDTGTAHEGMLYSFEAIPHGTHFGLEIEADNLLDWQKGLLWLGLQPFLRGEATLGGARSRGLGQVYLSEVEWAEWENRGDVQSVLALLGEGLTRLDPVPMERWQAALRTRLEEVLHA